MKPNRRLPFDLLSVATAFGVVVAVAALAYPAFKANPMSGPGMILIVTAGLIALIGLFAGGDPLDIRSGGPLAILVSLGLIIFGALTFVLDFDQADRMVAAGVEERESWRVSFGLVVGLVFLYLEILRLLSYFRD